MDIFFFSPKQDGLCLKHLIFINLCGRVGSCMCLQTFISSLHRSLLCFHRAPVCLTFIFSYFVSRQCKICQYWLLTCTANSLRYPCLSVPSFLCFMHAVTNSHERTCVSISQTWFFTTDRSNKHLSSSIILIKKCLYSWLILINKKSFTFAD